MSSNNSGPQNENLKPTSEFLAKELVFAAWEENLDKVKALAADGVDVNAQAGPGLTALQCAKMRGNDEILTWLLENGANPEIELAAKDGIADMVFKKNSNPDSPGGALAVVQDGSIVIQLCYGLANLEHKVPISTQTVFHVGSVAKQFTGFAIATLVQQGKISLEDDIRKYIPELNDFGYTIRIKHLLHHTGGLRDYVGTLCLSGWSFDDVISFDHILAMAIKQKGLNFEPGSEHLYSNTGYVLLAELVQRITGENFRNWTFTNIFQPLGMTRTHFHDDHTELVPGKAYGYALEKGTDFHALPDNLTATGPGALYSTIEDLAKWAINLDTHQVGGEQVFDLMYQQGLLNNGNKLSYASGLDIREYRGTKIIDHSGGWAGFTALVSYFPEYHFSAIVLYNINSDVYGTNFAIADIYLGEKLDLKPKNNRGEQQAQSFEVNLEQLDRYIGTYKVFSGWYITISREGNHLMALETNKEICPLSAVSETEFTLATWNTSIHFIVDESGQVSSFNFLGMTCQKVEPGPTPSLATLTDDFAGDYYSEELDVRYTVLIEDDGLVVKNKRHGTSKLTPAWKDNFRGDWWFMRSVEFSRDTTGCIDGLSVTQWQSRNHPFIKVQAQ